MRRQVNRYGHLLPVHNHSEHETRSRTTTSRTTPLNVTPPHHYLFTLGPESRAQLCDVIEAVAPPGELEHCLVLLNCLVLLATDDGRPLFL